MQQYITILLFGETHKGIHMSYPSYALFYKSDNTKIGQCFVNAGWVINSNGLYCELVDSVMKSNHFRDPEFSFVMVYEFKFTKEFFDDCTGHTREVVEQVIESLMKKQNINDAPIRSRSKTNY